MKLKRRYTVEPSIPLASMADLAMLLLVFFVICGKATSRSQAVPIEPPVSTTADDAGKAIPIVISVTADAETFLDGRLVDASELLAELEAIMQNRTSREERTVQIEVDRRTRYRDYVVAVDAVNRVKGYVELKVKR